MSRQIFQASEGRVFRRILRKAALGDDAKKAAGTRAEGYREASIKQ
jgi:hypothetical protein